MSEYPENYHLCDTGTQLHSYLLEAQEQSKLLVANFSTTWCGPCKRMKPRVIELARNNPDVMFCYMDADSYDEGSDEYTYMANVKVIPHYDFYLNGELKETVVGGNYKKVKEFVETLRVQQDENENEDNTTKSD